MKDSDFLDNYILDGRPKKLLVVSTGNTRHDDLICLFKANIKTLKSLFKNNIFIKIAEGEIQVYY